ncbi:hypothetical protein GQ43DRAFT_498375 [Delitschia confertaspora ATCC 74209]|uniref:Uncharacterized protein n=1 Tax=Delitschia confertaspora ATCC 74209 TaxID=1513339 RepID=A0A9P4JQ46_9PLEO|nr:hypothetical protein GQ43DRAFT_498375 [Delitschia confertaspora ATCC 74209]
MSTRAPFKGPWIKSLDAFVDSIRKIPLKFKASLEEILDESSKIICDRNYIHLWETDADLDSLLHIAYLIDQTQTTSRYIPQIGANGKSVSDCNILIAQEETGRDNFKRICELVEHITQKSGNPHSDGHVMAYEPIVVVRGFNYTNKCPIDGTYIGSTLKDAEAVVTRINSALLILGSMLQKDKIVWHHGPVVKFLNFYLKHTAPQFRNAFVAVTITSLMEFGLKSISISEKGKKNRSCDLEQLSETLNTLKIFAVFIDTSSQLLNNQYLNSYVYWWGYYHQALLPSTIYLNHIASGMDHIVMHCFRLLGAAEKKSASAILEALKKHIPYRTARSFVKECIKPENYTRDLCLSAGSASALDTAFYLADAPLLPLHGPGIQSFARLTVGTGAGKEQHYIPTPAEIDFTTLKLRAASPSPFRVWVPKQGETDKKALARTQDLFTKVIGHLLYKHVVKEMEVHPRVKDAWEAVRGACLWALDRCMGKMPGEVEVKVKEMRGKLEGGVWDANCRKREIFK